MLAIHFSNLTQTSAANPFSNYYARFGTIKCAITELQMGFGKTEPVLDLIFNKVLLVVTLAVQWNSSNFSLCAPLNLFWVFLQSSGADSGVPWEKKRENTFLCVEILVILKAFR